MLEHALGLLARGCWIFPIVAGAKAPPLITQWEQRSTRDTLEAFDWWQEFPTANVGIVTGRFREYESLIAVDVDVKGGVDGMDTLGDLALEGCVLPPTYTQRTPTGGYHFVYSTTTLVSSGVKLLGPGIDIRAGGGYIVGAGSQTERGTYTGSTEAIVPAPEWLIERVQRVRQRPSSSVKIVALDPPSSEARARAYLASVPPARQGEGGDHQTYRVAAACKDFGCSEAVTVELMATCWNDRCEPPWTHDELVMKIRNVYRYGHSPVGVKAPEAQFTPVEAVIEDPPVSALNREYAHCISGSSQVILWETTDERGRAYTRMLSVEAFTGRLANRTVQLGNGRETPLSKLWFTSPQRRTYDKIIFDPQGHADSRFYNLWRGFSFKPAATGEHPAVQMFLDHARENVCGGDPVLYEWLIGYFAHMIQRPWEKPKVALVFRGGKGVGKNALIERIGALMADNFLVAANKRYLVGNFNSHLERLLLFVLDEAFWSGDKTTEGVLKDLITGANHVIERKGTEPYEVANRLRVCIIGNEGWVIPASEDERRFAVFTVGEGRKQDTAYFTAMREGLEQGGYPHLLAYLQQYRITTDVNVAPQTQGLSDQKHASLDPVHQWWWDCLSAGHMVGSDLPNWPEQMDCEVVRNAYHRYVQRRRITARSPTDRMFNALLAKCARSSERKRSTTMVGDTRPYLFHFVSLDASRKDWEQFIGHPVMWGDG